MTIAVALKGNLSRSFTLDATFKVQDSGVTALFGPSGSGKTSLLRAIAGLDRLEGKVSIGDECWQDAATFTPPYQRSIGYVQQGLSLLPHLTVRANLQYASRRSRNGSMSVDEISTLAGIVPLLDRMPRRLSGGEAQRCAIARALIACPKLLLMDEPLAALDVESADTLLGRLGSLLEQTGVPTLYVTHKISEAERLSASILYLEAGKIWPSRPTIEISV